MKKTTMKDIAREANVTVTTVSYVLNDVKNQTIPEDTKNNILEIAKRLNYVPNLNARSLKKRRSRLIGILTIKNYTNGKPWREAAYFSFINQLEERLSAEGYHVIISGIDIDNPIMDIILERELDGVFLIDVSQESFSKISYRFDVPIIILDGKIDDKLFHKIIPDFNDAIQKSMMQLDSKCSFLVIDNYNDNKLIEDIKKASGLDNEDIHICSNTDSLVSFLNSHQNEKGIIVNELIGIIAARYIQPENLSVICTCGSSWLLPDGVKKVIMSNSKKSEIAVDIMLDYLKGRFNKYKDKYTVIRAD
jgi:transcriptional regulator with XRE-family HTH domain